MNKKCSHPDYYAVCINEWDDTQACVLCLREEIERLRGENAAMVKQWNDLDERNEKRHREWNAEMLGLREQLAEAVTSQKARDETRSHTTGTPNMRVIENLPEARRLLLEG